MQKLIYERLGLSGTPLRIHHYLGDPGCSAENPTPALTT
jgi:hypothetical protein